LTRSRAIIRFLRASSFINISTSSASAS
jgi:hypothetical protein